MAQPADTDLHRPLTAADLQDLAEAFPPDAAAGDRYPPDMMRWVDKS